MFRTGRGARILATVVALGVATAVVAAPAAAGSEADAEYRSVVVLGDSVAAGEGARDGYVYRDRALLPTWSTTRRGPPTTDRCGRTSAAYGVRVADALGAEVTNLSCTGASFERGIVLDDAYDRADPDLVLVTAGANSVAFERAYAYCVLSARGVSESVAERLAASSTVGDALDRALGVAARRILGDESTAGASACTAGNPGAYLRTSVLDRAGAVGDEARALAQEIRARGRVLGTVPEVVFTTYANPLPLAPESVAACPDAAGLGADELAFMADMFATLNDALRDSLADLPGVRVADPDPAFAGHRWCDADPWIYGPSIFVTDPTSRVPFHPTGAGQRAIADAVLAALGTVPGEWRGVI